MLLSLGNTAQSWWYRCAVRFFVRLNRNDAAGLTPSKEFLCKMTEKMQADVPPSRQAGFVRCCLYALHGSGECSVIFHDFLVLHNQGKSLPVFNGIRQLYHGGSCLAKIEAELLLFFLDMNDLRR